MSDPLNVALVGYGSAGRTFHAPILVRAAGFRLHTVVSSDACKVHADHPRVRVVASLEAAFSDNEIDLVVIAAPNAAHASLAITALRAGRHVVIDKPFATTLDEARQVIAAASDAGRIVSVFQNRRWDSDFLTLRRLIENGTLGDVRELHSHFDRFRPQVPDRWRERVAPGTGLWFDLGPHLVDQALQLFGMPLVLTADIAIQRDGAEVDDFFHVVLHYQRLRVVLHAGTLVSAHGLRFAVHGTSGSYVKHGLDTQEAALKAGILPGSAGWGHDPKLGMLTKVADAGVAITTEVDGVPGDYRAFYVALNDAIRGGGQVPVTATEALDVMRVLEAGRISARDGCQVAFAHC